MTQTSYSVRFLTGCHQRHSSKALAELIYENIVTVGKPGYTEEEDNFAKAVQKHENVPEIGMAYDIKLKENPPYRGGSSDVGDVTLIAPCATLRFPTRVPGNLPGHHWTVTATGNMNMAHKGLAAGAKVAAYSAFDLITKSDRLAAIRKEFEEYAKEHPYKSFLPDDANPPVGWNAELMAKYRGDMEKFYTEP
jgi:aminobenzoyl-glutamate utilization protein B